jgi:hypothetical protein
MEEKKRTITKVEKKVDGESTEKKVKKVDSITTAEEKSQATTKRIVAFILWAVALTCEILAILLINEKIKLPFFSAHDDIRVALLIPLVIFVVIDLICCLIASSLWKKASRLDPFKDDNKVLFFILTQLGAIMAIICLVPLIIFVLANKKLDKKTKTFVTIVAAIALLIAVLLGIDWNPISKKEKDAAMETITEDVFWSQYGRKYHIYEDCQTIRNSDLTTGKVQDAIDAGREDLCAFCAKRADIHNDEMKIEERSDVEELLESATTPEE